MSDDVRARTYLYLRLAILLLVLLLLVSVGQRIATDGRACIQGSISAYYWTPVRPVFVGVLCAIGACLVVYKGNSAFEDHTLNLAGILAVVVAFVPTTLDRTCAVTNLATPEEIASSVSNNIWSLFAVTLVAICLAAWLRRRYGTEGPLDEKDRRATAIALVLSALSLGAGLVVFVVARDFTIRHGHDIAAITMFAGIVAVAVANAIGYAHKDAARQGEAPGRQAYANRYAAVAVAMTLTLVALPLVHWIVPDWGPWLFWLEVALIVEFAAFWLVQTTELGVARTRADTR